MCMRSQWQTGDRGLGHLESSKTFRRSTSDFGLNITFCDGPVSACYSYYRWAVLYICLSCSRMLSLVTCAKRLKAPHDRQFVGWPDGRITPDQAALCHDVSGRPIATFFTDNIAKPVCVHSSTFCSSHISRLADPNLRLSNGLLESLESHFSIQHIRKEGMPCSLMNSCKQRGRGTANSTCHSTSSIHSW